MAAVKAFACAGLKLCEPLICVGLKSVLQIPEGVIDAGVKWVKERFTDHSLALTKAIATAHERAWQAVALALATDTLFSRVANLFRDGDLKAVQKQIREFVATADTGLDGAADGLRTKACNELLQLKKVGRFALEGVEITSLDLTRHASSAKVADDAHRAVHLIAAGLEADAPHLAQVLTLGPPGGGTPLLAAAFAYFLRRQIATNEELARDLTFDQLRLLTLKQQAGFGNLEQVIEGKWESLTDLLSDGFATLNAKVDSSNAKLDEVLRVLHVVTEARNPLKVTVESEQQKRLVKDIFEQVRALPPELLTSDMLSRLGDILAAAGQFKEAAEEQKAAADAAKEEANRQAEANAAYKQFKAECENRKWDAALAALTRAVALDEKRFRPVPKHYTIDAVIGAGSFGVVLKCRDTTERDDNGSHLMVAVKTFRETDLDRPLDEVFAEASVLKKLNHENVVSIHERGFADPEAQQRPFLAMEFVPGVTLEEHLGKNGKLNETDFTVIFRQIAAALHVAHTGRRQIIHRDLKPANVMVWKDGDVWRVKVIDFGLAVRGEVRTASLNVPHSLRATREKAVTGTVKYAAPEQLGEKPYPIGPHSDVFAFGKTALEALFGTVQPTPKHWKQLPDSLTDLLARCMDEEYDAKSPSAGRFHGFDPILASLRKHRVQRSDYPPLTTLPAKEIVSRLPVTRRTDSASEGASSTQKHVRVFNLAKELKLPNKAVVALCQNLGFATVKNQLNMLTSEQAKQVRMHVAEGPTKPATSVTRQPAPTLPSLADEPIEKVYTDIVDTSEPLAVVRVVPQVARPGRQAGDRFDLDLPGGLKMAFAWCPPGTFLMGSPESEEGRQEIEVQHEVRLTRGFYCGVHPVTQAVWEAVMKTNPSRFKGANLPIENVSWLNTQQFCKSLGEMTGKPIRLPTEAEWEYAARAGTNTPFYWGSELNGTQANCDGGKPYGTTPGPALSATSPVGGYAGKYPHPWGLTDVIGNVGEWCNDLYDPWFYDDSPEADPECQESEKDNRVFRGGPFLLPAVDCRSARRHRAKPDFTSPTIGFRIVFCPEC